MNEKSDEFELVDAAIEARETYREPHVNNAFEEQDGKLEGLSVETPELDLKIQAVETQIKALRAMGLHHTAEMNQQKLDRLLREKRGLQEG